MDNHLDEERCMLVDDLEIKLQDEPLPVLTLDELRHPSDLRIDELLATARSMGLPLKGVRAGAILNLLPRMPAVQRKAYLLSLPNAMLMEIGEALAQRRRQRERGEHMRFHRVSFKAFIDSLPRPRQ